MLSAVIDWIHQEFDFKKYRDHVVNAWPRLDDRKGIHHGNPRGLLVLLVLLGISSLILLWSADLFKASATAGNQFLARLNAPLVSTFYPQTYRDQIQVLLYDDVFINKEGLAWPLRYAEQAEYLRLAAGEGDPNLRPKAIFLDITFSQERPEDKSISLLRDALCTIQVDWGVPLFLAALPKERGGSISVRSGLMGAQKNGKPCFSLVDVTATQDTMDGYAWTYQLSNRNGEPSAALAMARALGGHTIETPPGGRMAVDWGVASAPDPILGTWDACQMGTSDQWPKFPPYLYPPGLFKVKDSRPVCPYHAGVTMTWLAHAEESDWKKLVHDKYVFVGAQITGLNDTVNSPVHSLLAGVHAHAMAFDNLMTQRGQYKLTAEWSNLFSNWQSFSSLAQVLVVVSLIVFLCKYFWKCLAAYAQQINKLKDVSGDSLGATFRRFISNLVRKLTKYHRQLSKLPPKVKWIFTFVGMTLIGIFVSTLFVLIFQHAGFRISYLAAMDLASLVIALEAFDILDDFVDWLKGKK